MGWIESTQRINKPWRSVASIGGQRTTKSFQHEASARLWWRIMEAPELRPADIAALNEEG